MRGAGIEIVVKFLNILTMISLVTVESIESFF
jgi:hypothetical protein